MSSTTTISSTAQGQLSPASLTETPSVRKNQSLLFVWALFTAHLFSFIAVVDGEVFIQRLFVFFCIATAFIAVSWSLRLNKDLANPLLIIFMAAFGRFFLPWLQVELGNGENEALFRLMGLRTEDWVAGATLASVALLTLITGWAVFLRPSRKVVLSRSHASLLPAVVVYVLGLLLLVSFFRFNATVETITTGQFRGIDIQQGSGVLFYLALVLIPASVLLVELLISRGWVPVAALTPVLFAGAAYFVLGGRARAATPIAAGLLILWYRKAPKVDLRRIVLVILLGCAVVWFLFLGNLYRGGEGLEAVGQAVRLEGFAGYAQRSSLVDIGHLHALAGAQTIAPGVLEGRGFIGSLTWPVSVWTGYSARNSGVLIAEETLPGTRLDWGFLPSLPGDSFLNFGYWAVFLVPFLFGAILAKAYSRLHCGRLSPFVYSVFVIYMIRIFFESISKWPEALVVLLTAVILDRLGQTSAAQPAADPQDKD